MTKTLYKILIEIFILFCIYFMFVNSSYARDLTPPEEMPSGEYELDKAHSSVIVRINHLGLSNYTIRFLQIDGSLYFDANNFKNIRVEASISPISISTGYPYNNEKDFDHELGFDEKWFNAKVYPEISLQTQRLTILEGNKAKLDSTIKMLGKEVPVIFDVKFNGAMKNNPFTGDASLGFSASGKINRSDWGMDSNIPAISNEVEINIEAEFYRKNNLYKIY